MELIHDNPTLNSEAKSMNTFNKRELLNDTLFVLAYGAIFILCQVFLYEARFVPEIPTAQTLLRYDASVYENLKNLGYTYNAD